MTVKYALRTAQSLTVMARKIANSQKGPTGIQFVSYHPATKIVLTSGTGALTKEQFDAIKENKTVLAMVEEGTLVFPGNKAMDAITGTRVKRLKARHDKLSRDQEERKEKGAEDRDKDAEIAELRAENKAQGERMDKMEAMLKSSQQAKTGAPKTDLLAKSVNNGNA